MARLSFFPQVAPRSTTYSIPIASFLLWLLYTSCAVPSSVAGGSGTDALNSITIICHPGIGWSTYAIVGTPQY